jgi:hypothetical protein
MAKIDGRFRADLLANDTVQMQFAPNGTIGNTRPLLAKNIHAAESDFVSFFESAPAKARAQISELVRHGHIEVAASIDEEKVASLCMERGTSA